MGLVQSREAVAAHPGRRETEHRGKAQHPEFETSNQFNRLFIASATALLTLTSLAKGYSATGNVKVLGIPEALLPMTIRQALWLVAAIEAVTVLLLLLSRSDCLRLNLILWLAGNFILYRISALLLIAGKPCPCLGSITENLPLKPATIDHILTMIVMYLFFGSLFLLLAQRKQNPPERLAAQEPTGTSCVS